jgi:hypothetical protein
MLSWYRYLMRDRTPPGGVRARKQRGLYHDVGDRRGARLSPGEQGPIMVLKRRGDLSWSRACSESNRVGENAHYRAEVRGAVLPGTGLPNEQAFSPELRLYDRAALM